MKVRGWILFLLGIAVVAALVFAGDILVRWRAIPSSNTAQTKFDTIIVLGVPCSDGGKPSLIQRVRVLEGVHEWKRGVAPTLILTGGAAHNQWVEADCMARFAEANGVPASAIFEERQALDTIQNIYYSDAIMKQHGWHSAEVVSNWAHLPRAALILEHHTMQWRTHVAAMSWYLEVLAAPKDWAEALYSLRLEKFGFKPSRFISR